MEGCVFCAIAAKETPAFRVLDEPGVVAFLDTRPVFKGHLLVVPRRHVETLGDLPPDEVAGYFATVRQLSRAVEDGLAAGGTFVAINNRVSQSVPHLHTHVIPRTKGDGLRGFFWPRHRYDSDAEAQTYADKIAAGA
ncbi:HIT family protein [Plantactinospora sp. GCM10030261]|uniref:HIT family protein n=1 Tax=Plantactinospora sp. GCM10030261 TaxID=3273420 RepID=UPI003611FCA7